MNREIKFRAWDGRKMYEVTQLRLDTGAVSRRSSTTTHVRVSNPVLMQYTGLKDKNGVEIYEGDLVATTDGILEAKFEIATDHLARFGFYHPKFGFWSNLGGAKVIGNIYENPELVERAA